MLSQIIARLLANEQLLESYATLASSLQLATRTPFKSLVVTSAQPAEGKTTTVLSLAVATMLATRKVLVVDGDLRRPQIHKLLQLPNTVGLTEVLTKGMHPQDAVQMIRTTGEDADGGLELAVITSGAHNPALVEATALPVVHAVLPLLASSFDLILVDSPPVLAVNDVLFLAPAADATVLVIQAGVTAQADVTLAKGRLEAAGAKIAGAVLNRFDEARHGPAYNPYSGYYAR
jgi:capsular exopolysaccharide synthesis family protein